MDAAPLARIALGFIIGPAVGLLLLGLVWCPLSSSNPSDSFSACWGGGAVVFMVAGLGALFAYPAAIVFGVPLFLIFRRRAWLRWWQFGLGGVLVGALWVLVVALYGGSLSGAAEYLLLCGSVGFVSGVAFWGIAVCKSSALTARC